MLRFLRKKEKDDREVIYDYGTMGDDNLGCFMFLIMLLFGLMLFIMIAGIRSSISYGEFMRANQCREISKVFTHRTGGKTPHDYYNYTFLCKDGKVVRENS